MSKRSLVSKFELQVAIYATKSFLVDIVLHDNVIVYYHTCLA